MRTNVIREGQNIPYQDPLQLNNPPQCCFVYKRPKTWPLAQVTRNKNNFDSGYGDQIIKIASLTSCKGKHTANIGAPIEE